MNIDLSFSGEFPLELSDDRCEFFWIEYLAIYDRVVTPP